MSTIGGPGGIGGPKGPKPPDDVAELDEVAPQQPASEVAATTGTSDLDAVAADLAAGKLTPHEAVEKLVDQVANGTDLGPADRAELRALMSDLIANDPHLGALITRL